MQIFHNTHYDFIKWRWHAMALSAAIIVAGIVMIAQRGLPLGIDFSGGTIVVYHFENKTVTEDAVRKAIESVPGEKVVQQYGKPEEHSYSIRLPQVQGRDDRGEVVRTCGSSSEQPGLGSPMRGAGPRGSTAAREQGRRSARPGGLLTGAVTECPGGLPEGLQSSGREGRLLTN